MTTNESRRAMTTSPEILAVRNVRCAAGNGERAVAGPWLRAKRTLAVALVAMFVTGNASASTSQDVPDITTMSVEDLMNMQVTSVSKRSQKVADAAAAVFVITQEDIQRSGARSIPEALRMVPGLQVARLDENKWAIGSRGFNGRFDDKLAGASRLIG